jgi:hypothetical protein
MMKKNENGMEQGDSNNMKSNCTPRRKLHDAKFKINKIKKHKRNFIFYILPGKASAAQFIEN